MKTKEEKGVSAKIDHARQVHIPMHKLKAGTTEGKIEIRLSDGRTIIYVHPSKDPEAVREQYERHIKFGCHLPEEELI